MAELLPALPHIDAGDLETRQQRYRADLILGVILGDAPNMPVVELQNLLLAALAGAMNPQQANIAR